MCRRWLVASVVLLLSACVSYSGSGLRRGLSTEAEVRAQMGEPAMRWQLPDGGVQLAYPRGPAGFHTWMVFLDGGGRLLQTVNVLDPDHFARVQPGQSEAEVLQLLGPSPSQWSAYYPARDELVREWRFCSPWGEPSRFDVLFDGSTRTVRTAYAWAESQKSDRPDARALCSR